jgi:predicted RNA-binding protein with PUA-like domain
MKLGDMVLFYHSNCKSPGIAGIAKIVKEGYPDHFAFDSKHPYFDVKSNPESPRWFMVDVEYVRHLDRFVSLKELQGLKDHEELREMALLKRGRLSIQPLKKNEFDFIVELSSKSTAESTKFTNADHFP